MVMLRVKNPCMNCENRVVGCHGSCEDYKAYKENLANLNKLKEDDKRKRRLMDDYFYDTKRRLDKRKDKIKYTKER